MRLSRRMRSRSVYGTGLGLGLSRKQHQIVEGGIVTNHLLSWWKHNDGAGAGTLTDDRGLNDGNIQGNIVDFWANTAPDGSPCGTYDANSEWVDGLAAANYDIPSGGITIMYAAYWDNIGDLEDYSIVKPKNYVVGSSTTNLYFLFKEGEQNHAYTTNSGGITAATWCIITTTFTFGTGASIKIYRNLNDVTAGSWTIGDGYALPTTGLDLQFGRWGASSLFFAGRLGDTLLYNRVLSLAEITQNFNVLKGRYSL